MTKDNELLIIYFVREHPVLWDGTKTGPSVDEAWEQVCRLICGEFSFQKVDQLKSEWEAIHSDHAIGRFKHHKFLGFLHFKECPRIRPTDINVAKYGNVVGYDEELFSTDNETSMRAVARMQRAYMAYNEGYVTAEAMYTDEDGKRKWESMKNGTPKVPQMKAPRRDETREGNDRYERNVHSDCNLGFNPGKRLQFNREKELRNRGYSRKDEFYVPGKQISNNYRANRFEGRRCNSGFGAYDPAYRPFGGYVSSFEDGSNNRKKFAQFDRHDKKPNRFHAPSRGFGASDYYEAPYTAREESGFGGNFKGLAEEPFSLQYGSRFDSEECGRGFGEEKTGSGNQHTYRPFEVRYSADDCSYDERRLNKILKARKEQAQTEIDLEVAQMLAKEIDNSNLSIRNDPQNYEDYYKEPRGTKQFYPAAKTNKVKGKDGATKKNEKKNKTGFGENGLGRFFQAPPHRPRRLSDENIFMDDFDSASDGEPYFNSTVQEFSDTEETNRLPKTKNSRSSTGTVIQNKKYAKTAQKESPQKPTSEGRTKKTVEAVFTAQTPFGDFEVDSEKLADAITWLNEPANRLTIKGAEKNRSGQHDDIERLILKKIELQNDYLIHWFKNANKKSCKYLAEFNFLQKQGVPAKLDDSAIELSGIDMRVAQTPYGPVMTYTAEEASAITFLNEVDTLEKTHALEKKRGNNLTIFEQELCKAIYAKQRIEKDFIEHWKRDKLDQPLSRLQLSEMKFIVAKDKGLGLDHENQIKEAKKAKYDEQRYSQGLGSHFGYSVSTKQGTMLVKDSAVAFALTWINRNQYECEKAKERLAIGSLGAMDLKIKSYLELQKKFIEENSTVSGEQKSDSAILRYCKAQKEQLLKEQKETDEFISVAGSPTDPVERNVALHILEMVMHKRRNNAVIWAYTDNAELRIYNAKQADAISWLNDSRNAATIAEVKRKLINKAKLGDIDMAIIAKLKLEREFVMNFRAGRNSDRTDFELSVLSPNELKFVQEKEKEYIAERRAQKAEAENRKAPSESVAVKPICEISISTHIESENEPSPELCEAEVHQGVDAAQKDATVRFVNVYNPFVSFTVPKPETGLEATPLSESETIEVGVEQVAEELNEEGFESPNDSPSISTYEEIPASGTRTQQLTRMMADLLADMEHTNPAEYQAKEEAILKMLGN